MSGYWLDIALVGLLVLLNAVFAGSEMALVSLREGQLRQLERRGGSRALRLVRLARDPNRFLATIQIGITLAGFLASATAAVSLAEPLVPRLSVLGSAAEPVAVAGVTLVLTFLTLVFGELAPKRLAMQRALPWALTVARPLDVLSSLSRPAVALLGSATNAVVRLLGGRTESEAGRSPPRSCATWSRAIVTSTRSSARSSAARWRSTSGCFARCSSRVAPSWRSARTRRSRRLARRWRPPVTPGCR
jgi:putative hemolysin